MFSSFAYGITMSKSQNCLIHGIGDFGCRRYILEWRLKENDDDVDDSSINAELMQTILVFKEYISVCCAV